MSPVTSEGAAAPSEVDVVIIGAGLAGLSAAWELTRAGLTVALLEAADRPGGRLRTDTVDGYLLDHGFQLINPSYPRLRRLARHGAIDLDLLNLRAFDAGVRVALQDREAILADPLRSPRDLLATLRAPVGTPAEKLAFAAWALRCSRTPVRRLHSSPDRPYGRSLNANGINGQLRRSVLEPFLAGVLAEDATESSSHFVELLIRSFVRGTPSVPARGVAELPRQLAAALPAGTVRLETPARRITGGQVDTDAGRFTGRAVLVAADPGTAAVLTGLPAPSMRALTTYWFAADSPPISRALLTVDGLRRGPIVNAAVVSLAAPSYAPAGQALIGCTLIGLPERDTETEVRRQAALMFPADPRQWRLLRTDAIAAALPAMPAPLAMRKPPQIAERLFVAGDHRDTASQQGALASGARAAEAIIAELSGRSRDRHSGNSL